MPQPTNTRFAVACHVLTYLAGVERAVSSDELAESTNASPVYIRRVLAPLRAAALVASRPGAHGGWVLSQDPASITLADVWRVVHGADALLGMHGPAPECPVGKAMQLSLTALECDVAGAVERELTGHTVAGLLRDAAAQGAGRV